MTAKSNWTGAAARKLKAELRAQRLPCWWCGQPIDYSLPADDPGAFSYDHAVPRSTRPDLAYDPANGRAAHSRCNKSRGTTMERTELGDVSVTW